MSIVTEAVGPGPSCSCGAQITDYPNRDISENDRGTTKNYAGTTGINQEYPKQAGTYAPQLYPLSPGFNICKVIQLNETISTFYSSPQNLLFGLRILILMVPFDDTEGRSHLLHNYYVLVTVLKTFHELSLNPLSSIGRWE